MDKIEEIDRLAALRCDEISALIEKSGNLPEKIAAADAKVATAAEVGDYAAYKIAARERDDLKAEDEYIRLRLQKLRSMPEVDPEIVKAAWEDYRKKYDPRMEQKIAEYEKAKRKMLEIYGEMVAMQTESAKIRRRFASKAGIGMTESCAQFPAKMIRVLTLSETHGIADGLVTMGATTIKDPDAVFYLSSYILQKKKEEPGYYAHQDQNLYTLNGVIGAGLIPE